MKNTALLFFYEILIVIGLPACTTLPHMSDSRLTLQKVETIRTGLSTKDDIRKLFGEPNKKVNLVEFPEQDDDGEIWHYRETPNHSFDRLSVYFRKNPSIVSGVGWMVKGRERTNKTLMK